ncbi:hypothetical protein MOB66_12595 [Bacillus haynesii]|uniref:hypothetical protein n=1 Tax=Bacillus haynesii TaxID=1925021 RepID=UPI002281EA95|nr:hypothetical protein [Bacillus haynesii]MCY7753662.1 hypothetical protein [Bacillus haynesii]MCY7769684.1 hypothetical protein [Bacillus haynesii]MCY7860509.1 hypothetical protein [Bacillus haynesii]MCY8013264.1 hypothetical protein [Bacillus haynesii]MCY8045688.1 hypothetical protein [Bacillus haynesii]
MKTNFVQALLLQLHFLNRSVNSAKRALAELNPRLWHMVKLVCAVTWFSGMFQLELLADEEKALHLNHAIKSIEEDFV